jgi:hypothetical protein
MAVQKKLTIAELIEVDESYKKQMEVKVRKMYDLGFSFILCWNYSSKLKEKYEYYKKNECPYVTSAIRGIYEKEQFEGVCLIALHKHQVTSGYQGRLFPSEMAKTALQNLGVIPVKRNFKATHFSTRKEDKETIIDYKFAHPDEVVSFL